MMELSAILVARPQVPIPQSELEPREIKPTLEENIRNLEPESQIRLILESEKREINRLVLAGKDEEAATARLRLAHSAEAERAEHANPTYRSMTRAQLIARLDRVQQTALNVTMQIEEKMGSKNPTGDSFRPLMLTHQQMEQRAVSDLYHRMHDLWFIMGLKYEALRGDTEAHRHLELVEGTARERIFQNLNHLSPGPTATQTRPLLEIESRINDDGYNILFSAEASRASRTSPDVPQDHDIPLPQSSGINDFKYKESGTRTMKSRWKKLKNVARFINAVKKFGKPASY
ncbi:hypothetical protein H072_4471 [Dactylellina haptotyla CBS 200.50]|uniref:Uncharacterized protein n=1 Tax=Dactylellina haptotyla (strain CBS 200.50) TaxID=1284197 RepID=S8C1Y8_DACHA|nr:hypothetical protein H072_4471 [Dactylellina haptotyla CBS 200.50]